MSVLVFDNYVAVCEEWRPTESQKINLLELKIWTCFQKYKQFEYHSQIEIVAYLAILIIKLYFSHFLRAQKQIASSYRKGVCKISTSETKIMIVLFYYGLFGIVSLSYFSVASINRDDFIEAIEWYFVCAAAGSEMECDRSNFEQFTFTGLVVTTYTLLALIPYVNLIFVIKWSSATKFCANICMRCCRNTSNDPSTKRRNQFGNGMDQTAAGKKDQIIPMYGNNTTRTQ